MIGIICEKPSARRNFAKALGGDTGVYKGEEYVIVNLRGHLYKYDEPHKQVNKELENKYKLWTLDNLPWDYTDFKWKRVKVSDVVPLINSIKKELESCSEIVIATDYDAVSGEGFLLALELLEETGLIKKKSLIISRMIFLDETPSTIQKAFKERTVLEDIYKNAECRKSLFRSRWDYTSQQFTRAAKAFTPAKLGTPRQGRLKSYIVSEVGQALDKYNNHIDKKFWQNRFIDDNENIYVSSKETKYDTKEEVPTDKYKQSTVTKESEQMKQSPPPRMYDMAKLTGVLASSGYSVAQIKNTYQKMYENSILSYPRTSDSTITLEQFNELLPLVDKIAELVKVDKDLLSYRKPRATHIKYGGSHGANRPGVNVPKSIEQIESAYGKLGVRIYTVLAKSFLSILAPNYEYLQQKGFVTDYPDFKTTVNIPKKAGWKAVLGNLNTDDEEETGKELGKIAEPIIFEGEYPKPKYPTILWLTKQMEKYNVGTGATRASTIGEMSNSKDKSSLLENNKGRLSLTYLGQYSYNLTKGTNIANVKLTEKVINTMESIGTKDEINPLSVIKEIDSLLLEDIETMKKNREEMQIAYSERPQPEKHSVTDKKGNTVEFKKEWNGYKFTDEDIEALSNGETIIIGPFQGKKGQYFAKGKLDWQTYKKRKFYGFSLVEFLNSKD